LHCAIILFFYHLPESVYPGLDYVAKLDELVRNGVTPSVAANALINKKELRELPAKELVKVLKAKSISDASSPLSTTELTDLIRNIVTAHPQAQSDYQNGKTNAVQFLLGQVLKQAQGKADPSTITHILRKVLEA